MNRLHMKPRAREALDPALAIGDDLTRQALAQPGAAERAQLGWRCWPRRAPAWSASPAGAAANEHHQGVALHECYFAQQSRLRARKA